MTYAYTSWPHVMVITAVLALIILEVKKSVLKLISNINTGGQNLDKIKQENQQEG